MRRSTLLVGVLMCAAVLSTRWVRLNISPSVPLGLYSLSPVTFPLPVGTLVLLPVPAPLRPWWSVVPVRLLKPVAAVAGDEVCVEYGWLRIASDWMGPVLHEAQGKVLPQLTGCQIVPEGEVFLASDAPRSLDSRYFGPVPIATLTAQAHPLLIWHDAGR